MIILTDAEEQKSDYQFFKGIGVCVECGTKPVYPGKVRCPACLEKERKYFKKYELKHREERKKYMRDRYRKKVEDGICPRCSKKATHGLYCYEHSIQEKRKNRERNERRASENYDKISVREMRKANGLCLWCGEPTDGKSNACQRHKMIFSEKLEKGRETFRRKNTEDFERMRKRNGKNIQGRTGTA